MKAQYDYDAAAEGELTLKEDQTLLVFGDEEDGWLLVQEEGGGKVGYVPGNYVEVISIAASHLQPCADYECSLVRSLLLLLLLHPLPPLPQLLASSFRTLLPAQHLLFTSTLQNVSALLPPRPRQTPSKPGQSQRSTRKARKRRAPLASAMVPYFSPVRPTRHVFEHILSVISRMVLT
jgi:Variant SH3 domain